MLEVIFARGEIRRCGGAERVKLTHATKAQDSAGSTMGTSRLQLRLHARQTAEGVSISIAVVVANGSPSTG